MWLRLFLLYGASGRPRGIGNGTRRMGKEFGADESGVIELQIVEFRLQIGKKQKVKGGMQ